MTHNQVGLVFDSTGARGFGFGFQTTERYGASGMASVGTFSWGGAYGSGYSVDPVEHLVIVFMINQLPNRTDIGGKVSTPVYQAPLTRPPLTPLGRFFQSRRFGAPAVGSSARR